MRCFADLGLSPEDLQEIMSDAPFQADIGEMEMEPSITVGFSSPFFLNFFWVVGSVFLRQRREFRSCRWAGLHFVRVFSSFRRI